MFGKIFSNKLLYAVVLFIILGLLPFFVSLFNVNLFAKFMCFAIVAIGLDIIWGYSGILSLGHGVFFGLGGYCMAMYLKMTASGGGLPDFMTWSGVTKLPFFWKPFSNPVFAISMVFLLPALLALVIGSLTFINRIRGVYFTILSQALALIMSVILIGSQKYTGGSNGLTGFTKILNFPLNNPWVQIVMYYVTLLTLMIVFLLCWLLVHRKIGRVLIAIRDGENRLRFLGYNTSVFKAFVYVLSAVITGIAGALYVIQVGIISPSEVGIMNSIEMAIWVAIGGKGTLIGSMFGAIIVNGLKSAISYQFPDLWSYFIGLLFIVVILFLPKGFISLHEVPNRLVRFLNRNKEEI
ncbi:MAG: urea ABC transporter permease subunit UrtC [Sporolactobacillus sp.]|nr:urea ABC transporter permease subunit UrtC [Sporolactobacillus sp.]